MFVSLGKLGDLWRSRRVCCGHAQMMSNLKFAEAVEPGNQDIACHIEARRALRAQGEPTRPSAIGRGRCINAFVGCAEPAATEAALAHVAGGGHGAPLLAALQTWKTEFR